jgi:hypothetical protein
MTHMIGHSVAGFRTYASCGRTLQRMCKVEALKLQDVVEDKVGR